MKLTDVDVALNEGVGNWVKAGIGALGASVGYTPGRTYAQQALEQNHFVNNFVKKMTTMLSQVWPQIQQQQAKAQEAKQFFQLVQQNKPVVFNGQTIQPNDPRYKAAAIEMKKYLDVENVNLAAYMHDIIINYAAGYDLSQYENDIKQMCAKLAANYQTNRGTNDLKDIAELLYSVIKSNREQYASANPSPSNPSTLRSLIQQLPNLSSEDLDKLVKAIEKQKQKNI